MYTTQLQSGRSMYMYVVCVVCVCCVCYVCVLCVCCVCVVCAVCVCVCVVCVCVCVMETLPQIQVWLNGAWCSVYTYTFANLRMYIHVNTM